MMLVVKRVLVTIMLRWRSRGEVEKSQRREEAKTIVRASKQVDITITIIITITITITITNTIVRASKEVDIHPA